MNRVLDCLVPLLMSAACLPAGRIVIQAALYCTRLRMAHFTLARSASEGTTCHPRLRVGLVSVATTCGISGVLLVSLTGLGQAEANIPPCTRCVDDYGAVGDGVADDTHAIQKAVDDGYDGVWHNPVRVLFGPGKAYRVSKQIVLWAGVQLDTDASNPATILLGANMPGYGDPAQVKNVFVSRLSAARPDCPENPDPFPRDPIAFYKGGKKKFPGWPWRWPEEYDAAGSDQNKVHPGFGPGNNFWSQVRNLRFRVEPGNSGACVIHYNNAQGSALYNLRFDLADDTYCAIMGGPRTMQCEVRGGRFGLVDIAEWGSIINCRFAGQQEAAYHAPFGSSRLWVGCTFDSAPVALKHSRPYRLAMIGCEIRNCAEGVVVPTPGPRVFVQNLKGVNSPVLYRSPQKTLAGKTGGIVSIPTYAEGRVIDEGKVTDGGMVSVQSELPTWNSVPPFIDVSQAANIRQFGAKGDGEADDTEALRRAVAAADTVFLPIGTYRLTDTVLLRPTTRLVGEHAILSHILVQPNTSRFTDQADPRPVLDTPDDPEAEVHLRQLSISAAGRGGGHGGNTGAIGLRWRAGRRSSIAWTNVNAHTSLLVTGAGGGTILEVWTATGGGLNKGIVIDHNREPLVGYGLCSEHQTDKALQMIGARDVTFYATGYGEGDYPAEGVMNEIIDSDRIALIFAVIHPIGSDEQTAQMTGFRIRNTPNIWIAPFYRIHEEPMKHTVFDTRPDGSVIDVANHSFAFYRWGEIQRQD
jgi:hypothetical protein